MSSDRIERRPHASQCGDEIGDALEREVFAGERDDDGVGGDERVERQQTERRRRIDEDVVEAVAQGVHERAEAALAILEQHELDLGAGEVAIRRDEGQAIDRGREHEVAGVGELAGQRLVDGAAGADWPFRPMPLVRLACGSMSIEEDPLSGHGEGRGEVDGCGGFADASLLVGDDKRAGRHFRSNARIVLVAVPG